MTGEIHLLPRTGNPVVTKQQLASYLGRSTRWVELRAQEGMPRAGLDRAGRRLFDVRACEEWLAARAEKISADRPVTLVERIDRLTEEVASLRAAFEAHIGQDTSPP